MQLSQLEYFVALAREQHFGRAAASCFVSQSALSEGIRRLETELDVPLVRRGHSFEGLTAEGERLVVRAQRMLAEHRGLKDAAATLRAGLVGQLRLGVVPAATASASLLIEPFRIAHPFARVHAETGLPSGEIIRRLHRFELDAGIILPSSEDTAGLALTHLYDEEQVVIASDALVGEATNGVTGRELVGLPLCLLHTSMRARQVLDAALEPIGIRLAPQVEVESVVAQVRSGHWAGIVPHLAVGALPLPDGVRARPLRDPVVRTTVALATVADEPVPVLARAFAGTTRTVPLGSALHRPAAS